MNALGEYLLISLCFVVVTMLEFALVLTLYGESYSLTDQIDFMALIISLIAYAMFNCVYFVAFM